MLTKPLPPKLVHINVLWYEWIKIIKLMSSFDGLSSKMSKLSGLIQYFWSPSLDGFSVFAPGSRTNFLSFLCGCPVFQPRQDGRLRAMSIQIAHQTSSQEWTLPIQSLNHPDFLSCYIVQCVYIYTHTHILSRGFTDLRVKNRFLQIFQPADILVYLRVTHHFTVVVG